MKYLVIVIVVLGLGASWYWWHASTPAVEEEPIVNSAETVETQATITAEAGEKNIYRNEKWGIAFEYPVGWEVREPAFGSKVSLFNLALEPSAGKKLPQPIVINVTPKYWVDRIIDSTPKTEFTNYRIAGRDSIYYSSEDMGMPTQSHFVLIENQYWVNISGKTGYETELNQVLESLTITSIEIEIRN